MWEIKARNWAYVNAYQILKQSLDSITYLIFYLIPSNPQPRIHRLSVQIVTNTRDSSFHFLEGLNSTSHEDATSPPYQQGELYISEDGGVCVISQ